MTAPFTDQVLHLLQDCAIALRTVANDANTKAGAATLEQAASIARARVFQPSTVPLAQCIDQLDDTPLVTTHRTTLKNLPWIPSWRSDDGGQHMALCTINEMLDLGDAHIGLMLVGSHHAYPEHEHAPQEAYFVLSGAGHWRYGGSDTYQPVAPGQCLYNHSMDRHGVKALDTPVLAMYILWQAAMPHT